MIAGGGAALFSAESAGSGLLRSEIETLKAALAKADAPEAERHDNCVRLGRLLRLSGDAEGAAAAWMEAAYAEKGKRDDDALLEGAACLMSIGEWDKADAGIKVALLTVRNRKDVVFKARYLAALLEAFRNGNERILVELAADDDFKSAAPAIFLTLWKLSGKDEYAAKLVKDYPESPEARAAAEKPGKNRVVDAAALQWFLHPGRESIIFDLPPP
ncbi:MAG: hypothetical protein LBS82_02635 [Spirochaetaceae bacterium]|nr:hypothetical protein [Spirochaetaceae bacterium]